jgi:hypothetical protein
MDDRKRAFLVWRELRFGAFADVRLELLIFILNIENKQKKICFFECFFFYLEAAEHRLDDIDFGAAGTDEIQRLRRTSRPRPARSQKRQKEQC